MVSCELDIKLRWHQAKSEITTKCDSGRFQRRREKGGRRGRPPRKTNRRTKPKPWVIYTFKSCCLILQQGGEMRRSQPSTQSVPLWLGWGVRLVGVQVWGHHLNKGPLRNFAQSCLDIQVCSQSEMPTEAPVQWYPFVKAVAIKGPAMPWPKPEPGCGLAALM